MTQRHLFLIGYDISDHRRRRHVLKGVQGHALGGQKSFYESWLSVGELHALMAQLKSAIDSDTDRIMFVRLDARNQSGIFGCAKPITPTDYFLIN